MSGRIALMVRGLPSIGMDEAVERFGKYYRKPAEGVFHSSESFPKGYSSPSGTITFVDKRGGYQGGEGISKQVMRDLRQLQLDFKSFTSENPSIYNASPTTKSRAKLYSRAVGMQNTPIDWQYQVVDTRRIAEQDLPYVKAIDSVALPGRMREIIRPDKSPLFIKRGDNVISASRINRDVFIPSIRGESSNALENAFDSALSSKRINTQSRVQKINERKMDYDNLQTDDYREMRDWANLVGLEITPRNASDVINQYLTAFYS
jgi:hypothetical protein